MSPKQFEYVITNLNHAARSAYSQSEFFSDILEELELEVVIPLGTTPNRFNNFYYQTIIDYMEASMTEEQRETFYEKIEFLLVQFIKDDKVKKDKLAASYEKWYEGNEDEISSVHVETIMSINDDNYKIEFLEKNKDRLYGVDACRLIGSLSSDELIEKCLLTYNYEDEDELAEIIKGFHSDDIKLRYLKQYEEQLDKYATDVVTTFNSDELKIEYIDRQKKLPYKVIRSLKDHNNIMKYWDSLKLVERARIIDYIDDEETKKYIINELLHSDYKNSLAESISKLSNDDDKLNFLKQYQDLGKKINDYTIIASIKDTNKQLEALEKYGTKRAFRVMRRRKKINASTILENIEMFITRETGITSQEEINKYKEYLIKMYQTNNDVLYTINFDILSDKYMNTLGIDKINFIGTFEHIQDDILGLNDKNYEVFTHVLKYYTEKNSNLDWTYVTNQLLGAFHWKECEEIINDANSIDDLNLEYLTRLLLDGNYLKIKTVDELNKFPELLEEKCERQINSDSLFDQIDAIMIKLCGITKDRSMLRGFSELKRHDTWSLTRFFGEDIELIEDSPYKDFIIRIKSIQKIKDPEELRKIYYSLTEFRHIDIYKIETALKRAYMKLYNDKLLQIDKLSKNEEGLYEAGTKFNIITTSIGAYVKNSPDNYMEDWNRPSLASQHFCTNFIRNDMISTAPIPHISYGFTHMDPDSLMLSGPNDIYSTGAGFISKAYNNEMYYGPDNQINQTYKSRYKYNEMDFRRIQNGIKKQPDYILVFRKDGVIPNLEEARKASEQWHGLPIVVVDIDLCLKAEYEKLQAMLNEFQETRSIVIAKQIIQKIINNRNTDPDFAKDIDIEEIKKIVEEQTKTTEETHKFN